MYTPNTDVYLLNTPLTIDGEHQIQFNNEEEQETYFKSCSNLHLTNFTYQRKDSVIRVPMNAEGLFSYNYVMYKNSNFSYNFYAYITKVEYINENVSHIHIRTDVFQTWFFKLTFNKSFIERSHPPFDEYNTLSDSVPTGQLVEKESTEFNLHGGYFVFCSTDVTQDDTTNSSSHSFTVGNYNIPCLVLYWAESQASDMSEMMQRIASHGWGDRVLSAVYVPFVGESLGLNITTVNSSALGGVLNVCTGMSNVSNLMGTLSFTYSPSATHKKSLTYPYSKIVVTDMTTGQSIELSPEKFDSNTVEFQVQCSLCETPTYKVIPKYYDGQPLAYNQSLVTRCNTSLPVANNTYAKYMMMNGEVNNLKMASAGVGILASALTGSAMGAITGVEQIMNVVAQENQASKLPNQVTALTDGAMERILFQNGIKVSLMVMDDFHQGMADDFWTMYGYPVRRLENPNLNNTENYRYIKIISPNIEGDGIPQEDMLQIENIFSKGVTLWNSPTVFKQY